GRDGLGVALTHPVCGGTGILPLDVDVERYAAQGRDVADTELADDGAGAQVLDEIAGEVVVFDQARRPIRVRCRARSTGSLQHGVGALHLRVLRLGHSGGDLTISLARGQAHGVTGKLNALLQLLRVLRHAERLAVLHARLLRLLDLAVDGFRLG